MSLEAKGEMSAMGQQSGDERERRAWSRLTQSLAVRNCVRALVFAGAVGATWLIGSSAASAHHGTDPEAEAQRSERGVLERLMLTHECPDESSVPPQGDTAESAGAQPGRITSFELTPDEMADLCATDRDPAMSPAPDSQATPGHRDRFEESEGTAPTDDDSSTHLFRPLPGDARTVVRPLANAVRPVTGEVAAAVAPVHHAGDKLTGTVAGPILDVTRPAYAAADGITSPVTDALADVTRPVTDEITGSVLPGLNGSVDKLLPPPVAGKPQGEKPATPAPPVAPGVDQSTGSTSTVDSDDEATPARSGRTGTSVGATSVPTKPVPVPLPAVPGTTVTSGTVTNSYGPLPGGGVTATVPAFPVQSAPESSALLATAYDASLRDLAGEPAVSPD